MQVFSEPLTLGIYTLLLIGITAMFTTLFVTDAHKRQKEREKLHNAAYPKWVIYPAFNSDKYDVYCIREEDFQKLYTGQINFMEFLGEGRFKAIYKKKAKKVVLISCGLYHMDHGGIMNMHIPQPYELIISEIDKCFVHGISFHYITINPTDYQSFMKVQPSIGQIIAYDTLIKPGDVRSHWHDICVKYNIHFLMPNDLGKQ